MGKFEDYIKKGKKGNRTLEGSMLAFCKVVADEKDLPIKKLNKDGERQKLKEAREDAKNNDIVKAFEEERVKNIITIKKHFKTLMTEIGLNGNIDEQKFRELLNAYRTKHTVPNFFKTIRPLRNNSKKATSFKEIKENNQSKSFFSRTKNVQKPKNSKVISGGHRSTVKQNIKKFETLSKKK